MLPQAPTQDDTALKGLAFTVMHLLTPAEGHQESMLVVVAAAADELPQDGVRRDRRLVLHRDDRL